ncbi:MAG: hypothetical protein HY926_03295 [Elusimicrobia bacterium]|nr:hypothetical protein [Elusimicrobiota bacterium]
MPDAVPADFGLEQILSDAFAAFKAHFGLVLGCFVVFAVIQTAAGKLPLLSFFVAPHLIAGFSIVLLKVLRDETPAFPDLFKGFSYYVPLLVAGLLMGVLLFAGLALLVVPGVFLGLMWSQSLFLLADDIREVEAGRKDKAALSGWGAMHRGPHERPQAALPGLRHRAGPHRGRRRPGRGHRRVHHFALRLAGRRRLLQPPQPRRLSSRL